MFDSLVYDCLGPGSLIKVPICIKINEKEFLLSTGLELPLRIIIDQVQTNPAPENQGKQSVFLSLKVRKAQLSKSLLVMLVILDKD